VKTSSVDLYVAAFTARCEAVRRPGQRAAGEPGVHGLLSTADDPLIRLLVVDDRAYDVLVGLLPDARGDDQRALGRGAVCRARRRAPGVDAEHGDGDGLSRPAHRACGRTPERASVTAASDAGMSIYLRLGFEVVARTTRFFHTG
jgi:hypothetical protein